MKTPEPGLIVRPIQQRLFSLLLRALATVILLAIALMLGSTALIINQQANSNPIFKPMISPVLEAYYQGHGSWEGIESLAMVELSAPPDDRALANAPPAARSEWLSSILLDQSGQVLVDHGQVDPALRGTIYLVHPGEVKVPLFLNSQQIGTLVMTRPPIASDFIRNLYLPLGLTGGFLAILTLVIGLLLTQRFIPPLAEVIAAARSVSSGNLSSRVKAQGPDDLKVLIDTFNQMASALERNDQEQRNMIADIAHELRTPLSILKGRLEGIIDGIYPADEAQIAQILDETSRLERLIEDLDMLAQAESRQLHFDCNPLDLGELTRQTLASLKSESREKDMSIQITEGDNVPIVFADPQRTGQVIINLVGNALRYSQGSQVLIQILPCPLEEPAGARLTVQDSGPGIPNEDIPFIFDRFWRGEKSRSRALGGAGLGLAIARQFIEIQGGTISARNLADGGFQIGFTLPAQPVRPELNPSVSSPDL
jgi:signal transduction histidine kinase